VGGLGIMDLDTQNQCLLGKWVFKLLNEDGMWQRLLRKKYLGTKTLTQLAKKPGDSHFWSGLMDVKDLIVDRGSFKINNGLQTRFWEDVWVGTKSLKERYPSLYSITRSKNVTVASVISTTPYNISFRRALVGENLQKWLQLVERVLPFRLNDQQDVFLWNKEKKGTFSVNSLYKCLTREGKLPHNCLFWRIKIPNKIKIFLWYLKKGVILTKDNLAKRRWKGSTLCCSCSQEESVQHLFFECHIARAIWNIISIAFKVRTPTNFSDLFGSWLRGWSRGMRKKILVGIAAMCWAIWISRNDVVFNKTKSLSFVQVMFRGTHWTRTWANLSKVEGRDFLKLCCRNLEVLVMETFNGFGWRHRLRLQG
jgi:hypothetical protein